MRNRIYISYIHSGTISLSFRPIRFGVRALLRRSQSFGSSIAWGNHVSNLPSLSSCGIAPNILRACRYVCRRVCWGRPVGLGFVCQAAINLRGSLFSPIRAIFPSHLTCLLAMMLAIGSIWNSSYRNLFVILYICTSNMLMLRIRQIDVVW